MSARVRVDAFLADSVVEHGGRLSALGAGFTGLRVPAVPVVVGRIGLGVLVSVDSEREAVHLEVAVRLEHPDGHVLGLAAEPSGAPAEGIVGEIELPAVPPEIAVTERIVCLGLNADGLLLDAEGAYRFVISVDDQELRTVPLGVTVDHGS